MSKELKDLINKNDLSIEHLINYEKTVDFKSKKKEINKLITDLKTLRNLLEIELYKQLKREK